MVSRLECPICFHNFDDFQHLPKLLDGCSHTFCNKCLIDWLDGSGQDTCPMCRAPINLTKEVPTNLELLAVFEKKKSNPQCNCNESRTHYCPTCLSQNYVDWEERRESGEHTFCFGCACNHFDEMEHKVKQLDSDQYDPDILESGKADFEKRIEVRKEPNNKCRQISIVIGLTTAGIISIALATSLCFLFKVFQL